MLIIVYELIELEREIASLRDKKKERKSTRKRGVHNQNVKTVSMITECSFKSEFSLILLHCSCAYAIEMELHFSVHLLEPSADGDAVAHGNRSFLIPRHTYA